MLISMVATYLAVELAAAAAVPKADTVPHLLSHPALSAEAIAFDYAGAIWRVSREGGEARLIAQGQGQCERPAFSPDGQSLAFTCTIDGNADVFTAAAAGGPLTRLTWHPGADEVLGWTPDGQSVLFRSARASPRDTYQLYRVPARGGPVVRYTVPQVYEASLSADGKRIAYTPFLQWEPNWKRYRGGQTTRIWVADLPSLSWRQVPRENSNDRNPMWMGSTLYFLSDRDGQVTLWRWRPDTNEVQRVIDDSHALDYASASAGPGGIVLDHFGSLELYDPDKRTLRTVSVSLPAERPELQPHLEALKSDDVRRAVLGAAGQRVLLEAHGEILSVPVIKGTPRNLTRAPGSAQRDPAPSPDGREVAWFSDASGEYALMIGPAEGSGTVRTIGLGNPPSFWYRPKWSPDGKHLIVQDKRLGLWLVDASGATAARRIATDRADSPLHDLDPTWSPDSQWVAFSIELDSHWHAIDIYSLATGRTQRVTDGLSDARSPRFDKSGQLLWFIAGTSRARGSGWLDLSSIDRPEDSSLYAAILQKDAPSPFAPESDEDATALAEAAKASAEAQGKSPAKGATPDGTDRHPVSKPAAVQIDFDGIGARTVAAPLPAANYRRLEVAAAGVVFLATWPAALGDSDQQEYGEDGPPQSVQRFSLKDRKAVPFVDGISSDSFVVSADGTHALYARKKSWFVVATDVAPKVGDKESERPIALDKVMVEVDPRAEWRQIYREAWRIERDFLYDPALQGLDLARAERFYGQYLEGLGSRAELDSLLREMTGQLGLGHVFVGSPAPRVEHDKTVGLLGADFDVDQGHYRIASILSGEPWNPKLKAPLAEPGVKVHVGDYLLEVDGRAVTTDAEVYRAFEGTAGRQITLKLSTHPDGHDARSVTVVPIDDETDLRLHSWIEGNRRMVQRLSGGRLGYVYVPDTNYAGFAFFNRYYYGQLDREGFVIDERFNHGGFIADYVVEQLVRRPMFANANRDGADSVEPLAANFGPKVMVINEMSGSGGDALPWLFRKYQVGPLVGTRTWGGLVGIGNYPSFIDGGGITAPRWALFSTEGDWQVENIGVPPDVEVVQDPALVAAGHDPQLEKAVEVALTKLGDSPPKHYPRAPYPDRHPLIPDAAMQPGVPLP